MHISSLALYLHKHLTNFDDKHKVKLNWLPSVMINNIVAYRHFNVTLQAYKCYFTQVNVNKVVIAALGY